MRRYTDITFNFYQVNQLTHVRIPVMLLPDDFKAYTKVKVDNLHFNKYVSVE